MMRARFFVAAAIASVAIGVSTPAMAGPFGPSEEPAQAGSGSTTHYGEKIEYRNLGARDRVLHVFADGTGNHPLQDSPTVVRRAFQSCKDPAIYIAGPGSPGTTWSDAMTGRSCLTRAQTLHAAVVDISQRFGYQNTTITGFSRGVVTANEYLHLLETGPFRGRVTSAVLHDPVFSTPGPRLSLGVHQDLPKELPIDRVFVLYAGGENRFSFPATRFTHPNLQESVIPGVAHSQAAGGYLGLRYYQAQAADYTYGALTSGGGRFSYRTVNLDPSLLTGERYWPRLKGVILVTPRENLSDVPEYEPVVKARVFTKMKMDNLYTYAPGDEATKMPRQMRPVSPSFSWGPGPVTRDIAGTMFFNAIVEDAVRRSPEPTASEKESFECRQKLTHYGFYEGSITDWGGPFAEEDCAKCGIERYEGYEDEPILDFWGKPTGKTRKKWIGYMYRFKPGGRSVAPPPSKSAWWWPF